jgi:hypothetical protein
MMTPFLKHETLANTDKNACRGALCQVCILDEGIKTGFFWPESSHSLEHMSGWMDLTLNRLPLAKLINHTPQPSSNKYSRPANLKRLSDKHFSIPQTLNEEPGSADKKNEQPRKQPTTSNPPLRKEFCGYSQSETNKSKPSNADQYQSNSDSHQSQTSH